VEETAISGARVEGAAIVYGLYDVGYEIDLERVLALLPANAPERARPSQGEAKAIHIPNPPITVALGSQPLDGVDGGESAELSARIFDFGVVSLRLRVPAARGVPWAAFSAFGNRVDTVDFSGLFDRAVRQLLGRLGDAVRRPNIAAVTEDYVVFRITSLTDDQGVPLSGDTLRDEDVIPLLLNERRPLSAAARRELLPHRFSYYTSDLAILTWDNALILDRLPEEADVQYVLEFANAQLLELRVYHALLDAELPRMYDRVAAGRSRRPWRWTGRYAPLLADLQTLVADSTEPVERVENALKVTGDVYLARIYAAALDIFRQSAWRSGIKRKLDIIRQTYEMLNAESQAARTGFLEVAVILLIVAELIVSILSAKP
jgi:hypothetical protein